MELRFTCQLYLTSREKSKRDSAPIRTVCPVSSTLDGSNGPVTPSLVVHTRGCTQPRCWQEPGVFCGKEMEQENMTEGSEKGLLFDKG